MSPLGLKAIVGESKNCLFDLKIFFFPLFYGRVERRCDDQAVTVKPRTVSYRSEGFLSSPNLQCDIEALLALCNFHGRWF